MSQWRSENESGSDDDELVEVVAGAPGRRRTWIVAVGACAVLLAGSVWAVTAGGSDTSARSGLVGDDVVETGASETDAAEETDGASTSVGDDWWGTAEGPGTDDSTPLGDDVLIPDTGSAGATYADFVDALQRGDQTFVDRYCAATSLGPWVMPDLVGRSVAELLTEGERRHLVELAGCEAIAAGRAYIGQDPLDGVTEVCAADPALEGVVAEQSVAAGSQPGSVEPFRITVYRYCGQPSTTVCVLVTMLPPYEGATTTVGWNCR